MAVVIGIVVGIGIFRLPPIVASGSASELQFIMFWVAGGFISLMGALCYAEISSSMPDSGGEYYFLRKAFGPATGFFLSWGRMTVIQTGSVALIAFILGDGLLRPCSCSHKCKCYRSLEQKGIGRTVA